MSSRWRARDLDLIDALDALPRIAVSDTVWRVVPEGRDPLLCGPSIGRWDLGHFDVFYTTLDPDGAIAEMYFHLSRQPVFPSTIDFTLNEIKARTRSTLKFADVSELAPSARWNCLNLILFSDSLRPDDLVLRASSTIDWADRRDRHGR